MMKIAKQLCCKTSVLLAVFGMTFPHTVQAADALPAPEQISQQVHDVVLSGDGQLRGQVVNATGQPVDGEKVEVRIGNKIASQTETDQQGFFRLSGLRGGVYYVTAAEGSSTIRAWAPGTAPPTAKPQVLVVDGTTAIRGLGNKLGNPWILASIAAAAIIIPLSMDDDGNSS